MNPVDLTVLLAARSNGAAVRSTTCPDESDVAAYVDGTLDGAACDELERHVADCDHCLSLVGLLSRERHAETYEAAPEETVAQARALVSRQPPRRWRLAPEWVAAAAMVVLAVPLLIQYGRVQDTGEGRVRRDAPATRTVDASAAGLQVLSPASGASVNSRGLAFRWTEVPGSPYYDLRIVTDDGDVVVRRRVAGTAWQPSTPLELQPGGEYFVHVDAYPSGDKAVSSDHVPFRVVE